MTIGQITKMAYIGTFPARRDVLKYESECAASLMNMDHNFFLIKSRKKMSHGTFFCGTWSECGSCFKIWIQMWLILNMNMGLIHFFGTSNSDSMVEITEILRSQEAGIMWFSFLCDISLKSWLLYSSSSFQLRSIQDPPGSLAHFECRIG